MYKNVIKRLYRYYNIFDVDSFISILANPYTALFIKLEDHASDVFYNAERYGCNNYKKLA